MKVTGTTNSEGAELVAGRDALPNIKVEITAGAFRDSFDDMIFALEEPRMGTGALPQFLVAKKVSETHKLVLTGHGGDELFSGYPVFKFVLLTRLLRQNPAAVPAALRGIRVSEIPHLIYFSLLGRSGDRDRQFLPELFAKSEQRKALLPAFFNADNGDQGGRADLPAKGFDAYQTLLGQYLQDYLPGLLMVEDKISMAHGLEFADTISRQ